MQKRDLKTPLLSSLLVILIFLGGILVFTSLQTPTGEQTLDSCQPNFYGKQLIVDASTSKDLLTTLNQDVLSTLQKITSQSFTLKNTPSCTQAIYLLRTTSPLLDKAPSTVKTQIPTLKSKTKETFLITSINDQLWIVSNSEGGLEHGIYYYLEQLGMRWYFPNEHWTITPKKTDIRLPLNQIRQPKVVSFSFFGTGGFGSAPPGLSEDANPVSRWGQWFRRNQFPDEYHPGGHSFEVFNLNYQTELRKDPLYFAEINGVRQKLWDKCLGEICNQKYDYTYNGKIDCKSPQAMLTYAETKDTSGKNHHGQVLGTPSVTVGKYGQAYSFDGKSAIAGQATVGLYKTFKGDLTLSAWIKTTNVQNSFIFGYKETPEKQFAAYLSKDQTLSTPGKKIIVIQTDGTKNTDKTLKNVNTISTSDLSNEWTHIAVVRTVNSASLTTQTQLYINGKLQNTHQEAGIFDLQRQTDFWIAQDEDRKDGYNGLIDEVQVYQRSLTGAEIGQLFNHVSVDTTNLLLTYPFDQEAEQFCEDKTDYSTYGGIIKFFADSKIANLEKWIKINPEGLNAWGFSIEPSDGSAEDESQKAKDLLRNGPYLPHQDKDSSTSDRVFHFANQIAKETNRRDPGKYVSLYAYSSHSSVPTIPLEKNILVKIAQPGEKSVKAWKQKSDTNPNGKIKLGGYDYWAITTSSRSLPLLSYDRSIDEFRTWEQNDLESIGLESTYSSGAIGTIMYSASKLAWDQDTDTNALMEEFYENSFGPAKEPMKRMLTRWNKKFLLMNYELGASYHDILEADALAKTAKDPAIQARINDYKLYLNYLRLHYEYVTSKKGTAEKTVATEALLRYIWRIDASAMIHSYQLYRSVLSDIGIDPSADKSLVKKWDIQNKNPDIYNPTYLATPTNEELDQLMKEGAAKYQYIPLQTFDYSDKLVPLNLVPPTPGQTYFTQVYKGTGDFEFYTNGEKETSFEIRTSLDNTGLKVSTVDGEIVYSTTVALLPGTKIGKVTVPKLPKGDYHIDYDGSAYGYGFNVPSETPFVAVNPIRMGGTAAGTGLGYFFIPKGIDRVIIFSYGNADSAKIYAPSDYKHPYPFQNIADNEIVFETNGMDGQIWGERDMGSTRETRFINTPEQIAPSPEQLLVPENVAKETTPTERAAPIYKINRATLSRLAFRLLDKLKQTIR